MPRPQTRRSAASRTPSAPISARCAATRSRPGARTPPTEAEIDWIVPEDTLGLFVGGRLAGSFDRSTASGSRSAASSSPWRKSRPWPNLSGASGPGTSTAARARLPQDARAGRCVSMLHPFRESFLREARLRGGRHALEIEAPTSGARLPPRARSAPAGSRSASRRGGARAVSSLLLRETAPASQLASRSTRASRGQVGVAGAGLDLSHDPQRRRAEGKRRATRSWAGPIRRCCGVRDPYWSDLAGRNALLRFFRRTATSAER